ncbi:hypothetical protein HCH15_10860 [Corynebacterium testudinoris]|uniref:Uncharacterized protein n=1 Tax=Corynebacterium testudinoris TaxID=136857 RepID=A0A0G3HC19_9CORY|nr:hypothetical protein [Corynebacterium testudinoris]AKK09493.1 hypothetical protein CTEST_10350 [Corynebacterium testudinoris]MBX8996674.1 hypothetical protein [Corynebacterium testudinoris]
METNRKIIPYSRALIPVSIAIVAGLLHLAGLLSVESFYGVAGVMLSTALLLTIIAAWSKRASE